MANSNRKKTRKLHEAKQARRLRIQKKRNQSEGKG